MKNIFNRKFSLISVLAAALILAPSVAYGALVTNTNPTELNDGVQLMVNVANWILGIVGSLALLMFVIGGFMFLISAGNSKTVDKGKSILISSVVGLVIVFCSYMIIQFSMSAMGLKWSGTTAVPKSISTVPDKCDSLKDQGYSCMNKANGKNCKTGFCASQPKDVLCCQPN